MHAPHPDRTGVQVAQDLTQTLMTEQPSKAAGLEYQGLLAEMRSLRLQLGADELADHLQIVECTWTVLRFGFLLTFLFL